MAKYTISTYQLNGTKLDGGGTVTITEKDKKITAEVNIKNSRFTYNDEANVTMSEIADPFPGSNVKPVEVYCIEKDDEFWMVLVTNPFQSAAQPAASGSLAGKSGGVWSIAGHS